MMFKTHLAFSFLVALGYVKVFSIEHPGVFVVLITVFGSLPDLDTTKSKIGRKFWFLAMPMSLVFRHRGFFHSIFPALLLFLFFRAIGWNFLAVTLFIAYLAHLLGDALTIEGVNFLHPISTFRIQGFLRTGSFMEMILFSIILAVDLLLGLRLLHLV